MTTITEKTGEQNEISPQGIWIDSRETHGEQFMSIVGVEEGVVGRGEFKRICGEYLTTPDIDPENSRMEFFSIEEAIIYFNKFLID